MTTLMINNPNTDETITFEAMSREAYLAERAAWRKEYAELSNKIRAAKLAHKEAQRCGLPAVSEFMTVSILRDYAREAMEQRAIMKLKAAASYDHARKETKIAA